MTTFTRQAQCSTPLVGLLTIVVLAQMAATIVFCAWVCGDGSTDGDTAVVATAVIEIDHKALIGDSSPAVLTLGKKIYETTCAACHGMDGSGVLPNARKFISQPFQNVALGAQADPFSMFDTVTNGFNKGAMPSQAHLSVEERYAAIHYIRETFVKTKNATEYVEIDAAYLAQSFKPVVKAPRTGPHPATVALTVPVYGVLAHKAHAAAVAMKESQHWLASLTTISSADGHTQHAARTLATFAGSQMGAAVYTTARTGTAAELQALLLQEPVSALTSVYGALSTDTFADLYTLVHGHSADAAPAVSAPAPAQPAHH